MRVKGSHLEGNKGKGKSNGYLCVVTTWSVKGRLKIDSSINYKNILLLREIFLDENEFYSIFFDSGYIQDTRHVQENSLPSRLTRG